MRPATDAAFSSATRTTLVGSMTPASTRSSYVSVAALNPKLPVPVLQPYLKTLAEGKTPVEKLFGDHWRDWVRKWVQRICLEAKVPQVTAHGMRGLHSTLALEHGASAHVVASSLGHESFSTTVESYAKPEAIARARQRRVLTVLDGGRFASSP
jgi:integrase